MKRSIIRETEVLLDEKYGDFKDETHFLSARQRIVGEYVKNMGRGLLCHWETGRGKTRLVIGIIESIRAIDPNRAIRFMCPKSLVDNVRDTAIKYMKYVNHMTEDEAIKYIDSEYNFISSNASNMYDQVTRPINRNPLDDISEIKHISLENSALFIDEAQLLFNSITNGSQNAVKLYDLIMRTKNIKLIFLSATPITNDPFEIVPCFNMLSGNLMLFPEDPDQFEEWYVDGQNIKNKQSFQRRIFGMVTHYGSEDVNKREGFPEQLPIKVERVQMSAKQQTLYGVAVEKEMKETGKKNKKKGRFGSSKGNGTYRVHSRIISNYIEDEITPKFEAIYKNIMINIQLNHRLGYVYSNFVEKGLDKFGELLASRGWKKWDPTMPIATNLGAFTYASYNGSVPVEERKLLVDTFNSPENYRGGVIDLVLISSGAGSVGLSFLGCRHEHIMEPAWNLATIEQALARGIRNGSHAHLEVDERIVQTYIYLSVIDRNDAKKYSKSTDEDLYDRSIAMKVLIDKFTVAMAEASIDCKMNQHLDCLRCPPSDEALYYNDIGVDIKHDCTVEESDITVHEVFVGEQQYFYRYNGPKTMNNLEIYEYKQHLDSYVPVKGNMIILEAILNADGNQRS